MFEGLSHSALSSFSSAFGTPEYGSPEVSGSVACGLRHVVCIPHATFALYLSVVAFIS